MINTLFWIIVVHVATIIITYPSCVRYCLVHRDKLESNSVFTITFIAKILAIMPGLNIIITYTFYRHQRRMRNVAKMADTLRKHFENHPDPQIREDINRIVEGMKNLSKYTDRD